MTCLSSVSVNSTTYFAGFNYNLKNILVRMNQSSDTNASVFQLKGVKKNIKPTFECSVLNDKTSNFFEGTRETCKISLSRPIEEKTVSIFPKVKNENKRGPFNRVSFENLVSPKNL
jgi:hypothetical protein